MLLTHVEGQSAASGDVTRPTAGALHDMDPSVSLITCQTTAEEKRDQIHRNVYPYLGHALSIGKAITTSSLR
jgi:hypothetical protein